MKNNLVRGIPCNNITVHENYFDIRLRVKDFKRMWYNVYDLYALTIVVLVEDRQMAIAVKSIPARNLMVNFIKFTRFFVPKWMHNPFRSFMLEDNKIDRSKMLVFLLELMFGRKLKYTERHLIIKLERIFFIETLNLIKSQPKITFNLDNTINVPCSNVVKRGIIEIISDGGNYNDNTKTS